MKCNDCAATAAYGLRKDCRSEVAVCELCLVRYRRMTDALSIQIRYWKLGQTQKQKDAEYLRSIARNFIGPSQGQREAIHAIADRLEEK